MRQPRMTVPYGTWLVVNLLQRTDTFIQTSTEEFSLVDRDLGIAHIDEEACVGCGKCAKSCPAGCIEMKERTAM